MKAAIRSNIRLIALLLVFLQVGVIAHRMEHYLLPHDVETGEGGCPAFSPVTDPPVVPVVLREPTRISYAVRFWTVCEAAVERLDDRLGFRAHAPPSVTL